MPKIYRISKAALRVFYKVRHHRGHGIHSPFVFALITKVVEEKLPYYFYKDLEEILDNKQINKKATKYDLLSFRLVNYFNPATILEVGSGEGLNTLCLTSPSKKIRCKCFDVSRDKQEKEQLLYEVFNRNIEQVASLENIRETQDCIYLNLNHSHSVFEWIENNILSLVETQSFIIIKGIRTNKRNHLLWNKLKDSDKVTVSLDLYNLGILFFDPKLYKRNYRISF